MGFLKWFFIGICVVLLFCLVMIRVVLWGGDLLYVVMMISDFFCLIFVLFGLIEIMFVGWYFESVVGIVLELGVMKFFWD